jgi:elongation factor G
MPLPGVVWCLIGHFLMQVEGFSDKPGGMKAIGANVPLAAMFNYVSNLRSMTKGRGSYQMKLADYQQVPPNIQEEIVAANKTTV